MTMFDGRDDRYGERVIIVFDGAKWFTRKVRLIEHDVDRNEQVYRCDWPIGGPYATVDEAVAGLRDGKWVR